MFSTTLPLILKFRQEGKRIVVTHPASGISTPCASVEAIGLEVMTHLKAEKRMAKKQKEARS